MDQALDPGEGGRQRARTAAARTLVVHFEQAALKLDHVKVAAVALEVGTHALVDEVGDEGELLTFGVGEAFVVQCGMATARRGSVGMGLRLRGRGFADRDGYGIEQLATVGTAVLGHHNPMNEKNEL